MNKFTLLFAGLMISGVASANPLASPGGKYTMDDSSLLNENVTINLSSNVTAGVVADEDEILIATCHQGGRTTARQVTVNIPDNCTPGVDCTGTEQREAKGAAFAYATTRNGTVTTNYPESFCDDTGSSAETVANSLLTP